MKKGIAVVCPCYCSFNSIIAQCNETNETDNSIIAVSIPMHTMGRREGKGDEQT